jgi:hypothetical protein
MEWNRIRVGYGRGGGGKRGRWVGGDATKNIFTCVTTDRAMTRNNLLGDPTVTHDFNTNAINALSLLCKRPPSLDVNEWIICNPQYLKCKGVNEWNTEWVERMGDGWVWTGRQTKTFFFPKKSQLHWVLWHGWYPPSFGVGPKDG